MTDEPDMQLLITGCYRTGSEYITHLINNSPDIYATMYVTNYMRFCYGQYDPIDEREQYTSLVFDTGRRMRLRWGCNLDVHRVLDDCESREVVTYGSIYDAIIRDIMPEPVPNWAEKTQLVWQRIPDFLDLFEHAKTILIVRDPRSILASFKNFTYAPEPRYLGAIFNALDAMQHGREFASSLPADQFHLVKYENVVLDPRSTVSAIFDFLSLPTDHDLMSEEGWTDPAGDHWGANSAFEDGSEFDKQAAVNRWQGNLEPWEIALCERVNGDVMEAYGYELAGTSVPTTGYEDVINADPQIKRFYEKWKRDGSGVEKYPTDPTDPGNWAENN